jgi:hypothetical protein
MPKEYIKFDHGRFIPHIFQSIIPYNPVISRYCSPEYLIAALHKLQRKIKYIGKL